MLLLVLIGAVTLAAFSRLYKLVFLHELVVSLIFVNWRAWDKKRTRCEERETREHAENAQRKYPKQEPSAPFSPPLRPFTTLILEFVMFIACLFYHRV